MNRKRYVVEVWGEEVVKHKRLLIVEVPDGTSIDEIEALDMGVFDDVPEPPAWEHEYSDGIFACDGYVPEVQREASGDEPVHCKLIRNEDGELVMHAAVPEILPHTPRWFSPNCLPHKFDLHAECPHWLAFLHEVFDGDQERISALQQWFGYNLVSDNRHHKMALLLGPPRSGKGTTLAVMSAMLGRHNVANTSLAALGGRFGLEPLVEKMSALIDEGHLGKYSDTSLILERLKAISGGSEQTVDRKGVAALASVALKVRFTIAVNEIPRLSDSSAAMRSRLLVIPFFNTYEGREDVGLVDRLLAEIPGITNWALSGFRDLKANGRFNNPAAGEAILRDFVYLSSPMQAFLDECCEVDPEHLVRRKDIQLAWRVWCEENGHVPGSIADFGRKLRAVLPKIVDEQRRVDGLRDRWYVGFTVNSDTRNRINRLTIGV